MRNIFKIVAAVATVAAVSATAAVGVATHGAHHPVRRRRRRSTPRRSTVGFSDSDIYGMSPDDVNRTLDLMTATGVRTVRVMMPWAGMEPNPGQYDFGQVDLIVDAANARGMSVLGTLVSSPGWAVAPGTARRSPARRPRPARTATSPARRPATSAAGCRPTRSGTSPTPCMSWTSGPQGPEPAVYAGLLKAAYPKIKGADPSALVVGGVVGAVVAFFALTMDPVTFVEQMYAAGAQGSFDALSYHPYQYTTMFSAGGNLPNSPTAAGGRDPRPDGGQRRRRQEDLGHRVRRADLQRRRGAPRPRT